MARKRTKLFLLVGASIFLFAIILNLNFTSADFVGCWANSNTDSATCTGAGSSCVWKTPEQDPWCDSEWNPNGCCMEQGCWLYDGSNESACESDDFSYGLNCTWDPYMTMWYPNGTQAPIGGCMMDWMNMDTASNWGGVSEGCWQYDGDQASCGAQGGTCKWSANDQNQQPWCWIKTLTDAQDHYADATTSDIGCCETSGCWIHEGNQTTCETAFQGNCWYDSYGGWCNTKSCGEIATEANCTYAKQNLMMPCNWTESACSSGSFGTGGFGFYEDSDSCFNAGGWYNSSGDCVMPSGGDFGAGAGGFMFAGNSPCWFADNQPDVCNNVTGCAYCVSGSGDFGTDAGDATNICSGKTIGWCEGHDIMDVDTYDNADNSAGLTCTDIQVQTACNYGPLPNCKWSNSSTINGTFCEAGAQGKKTAPPVQYCEDPSSKNNFTLCNQLAQQYMMPCKWQNTTYPITNCTFNDNAVFGDEGEKNFEEINSQFSCTSAGGSWNTEYYVEGELLKQDSWCEMTGMFDIDLGQGMNNKGNCDTSCWACEFQANGTVWANVAAAETACDGSALGYCVYSNASNAFNSFGWCDFPKEMEYGGAKECDLECEGCNFMNSPQTECEASMANNGTGCKWVSEYGTGYCADKTKKVCETDCFSCYDVSSCQSSSINCAWDTTFNLCSPEGYEGEICFNGVDDDSDTLIDCADPDCGFDNFCGGDTIGGDCWSYTTELTCNQTIAFNSLNCTWINDTWNTDGWCDMPGANCWKFDHDLAACGDEPGCTNSSSGMGGAANFCDINTTRMDSSNCWSYTTEANCADASGNCQWQNDTWCQENSDDDWCTSNPNAGWCGYKPFEDCMNLNETSCTSQGNCTWSSDEYSMVGGWCNVACMNWSISDEDDCKSAGAAGLCEWRDMSSTCQPETFMIMCGTDGGGGGKTGCWQYDGDQASCVANNITCTYVNDTYANNNVSESEYDGYCMNNAEYQHFGGMEGDVPFLADDAGNVNWAAEPGITGSVDIIGTGMRTTDEGFNFGASISNISDSIICKGYSVGVGPGQTPVTGLGNSSGEFYWYLDTDNTETGGCVAVPDSGDNLTGFDFLINYISRNTTNGLVETKQLMRCSSGSWMPTNALITTSKKMSCGEISGVMVALAKQDIEAFTEYNKTANMRIFMSSADADGSRLSPSDSVGPGYYTPGTIDFGFVDCSDPTMAKDPKCKNFQKFGFNVFEECKNGVDDDENGLVDCDDPFCTYIPDCASGTAFNFSADSSDLTAPTVMFSDVEKLYDSAFVRIDTNEPSNMSLTFFKNDSNCDTANLNATLNDVGSGDAFMDNAQFKPFHSVDIIQDTIGYDLTNGTAYYYKVNVCDPSNNCATSTCSNFTTKVSTTDKSFIFKLDLPANITVDIPAFGKTNYNFTETFGGVQYEVGIKTNTSVTKNMNMTLHCGDMSIGMYGMNVLNPTKLDLTNAFVCDEAADYIGMNSTLKKWNKMINEVHLGGASDYIEITLPTAYNSANTFQWTDDVGADGQDVDDYVECSGDTTSTTCKVPVSMGFSAYALSTPDSSSSSSSGGGGGGGGVAGSTTYTLSDEQFAEGFTKEITKNNQFKVVVEGEEHRIKLTEVGDTYIRINISSETQKATLSIGDTRRFEVSNDSLYDILVTLNGINITSKKANMTVQSTNEEMTSQTEEDEIEKQKAAEEAASKEQKEKESQKKIYLIVGILVVLVILFVIYFKKKD